MHNNAQDQPSRRCVKCLAVMSDPDWIVNKDMAYCLDCTGLLHLGESKESRMFSDMHEARPAAETGPLPEQIRDASDSVAEPLAIPSQDSGGDDPGGENSGGENSGGEEPGGENPGGEEDVLAR